MRKLLSVLFILIICFHWGQSQQSKAMEGVWLGYKNTFDDGSCDFYLKGMLNFKSPNLLNTEHPGVNAGKKEFQYTLTDSTFTFYNSNDSTFFKVDRIVGNQMVLMDSWYTKSYVKLPDYGLHNQVKRLKAMLSGGLWEFEGSDFRLLLDFDSILRDSSLILPEFHTELINLKSKWWYSVREHEVYWSTAGHGQNLILRIQDPFYTSRDLMLIVKEIEKDSVLFDHWSCNGKSAVKARKVTPIKEDQLTSQLTASIWQLSDIIEYKNERPIDMGSIGERFEYTENYHRDSTLLLTETDLLNKTIRLKFDENGRYEIRRLNRVLDHGTWHYMFDNFTLKLVTDKGESEGIHGGYIFIEDIDDKQMTIVRKWPMEKNLTVTTVDSDTEVYRLIKN